MIEGLRPYPSYRESGLDWLGKMPSHWQVRRLKTVLHEQDRRSAAGRETLLSLTRSRGLISHAEMTDKIHGARTLSGYKVYMPGQIVMNRMQAWSGMFGIGTASGLVSPDYAVFDVINGNIPAFVLHRIKNPDLVAQFALESKGIGSGFNRLYSDRLGAIPATVPPPEEQAAIVRFLDWANGRLERAIRAKRKVIALLNEQKQAIIHRAVTRGLDPNAPLKPSGIPWLGDIPAHWGVSRLKFAASHIVDCIHATPHYAADGEFPAIRTADVEPGWIRLSQTRKLAAGEFERWISRHEPLEGDILYSREGERYGIAAPVPKGVRLCISQRMMVFRIRHTQDARFVMWQLNCPHVLAQASVDTIGAAAPHVNVETIRNYRIVVPSLEEQVEIVEFVDGAVARLTTEAGVLEREIELIREYRTRLIADVVTGKLDVRAAAANLPDEAAEPLADTLSSDSEEPELEEIEA